MDSPIFIVGLPRSGSTLWLNLFARNPELFGIGELLFLTPPWRRDFRYFLRTAVGDLSQEDNLRKMIDLMFSGKKISGITASFWQYTVNSYNDPDLKERIFERLRKSERTLPDIFRTFIEELAQHNGFNRCCVKFPVFVNYIPDLLHWYPNCKIIHITRDPRAMAVSRANFRGEKKIENKELMMLFAIMQYQWTSKLHEKYKGIENYTLARYEDLLSNPENTIREMCDFAGVEFVPQMLEPEEGQESSLTGEKNAGFNLQLAFRWKNAIHPVEARLVTLITRSAMKRFEYVPEKYYR